MSDINTLFGIEVESGLATLKQRLEDLERRIQAEEAQKRAFGFPDISRDVHLKGRNETTLRPLIADLFHAFAEKAMVLLAETHPSLIPLKITDDSTRIPILAAFVQSIPIEVYESWGLPGYQQVIGKRFAKLVSVTKPKYFCYDYYDMAQIFSSGLLHPDHRREREVLGPIFMFVFGKSFEEMIKEKEMEAKYHSLNPFRQLEERRPWSETLGKQTWRETKTRGKRSGGRKGRT